MKGIVCTLCPKACCLKEGQTGSCKGRMNLDGKVIPVNYAKITAAHLDPVEKKPLRHFFPGKKVWSIGSFGCNLKCPYCQNFSISMAGEGMIKVDDIDPDSLVAQAKAMVPLGNIGVAFTYNEPLIGYEYVRDCSQKMREADLKTILVTNGFFCREPWQKILPWIDAINIDLKGYTESFYKWIGGDLSTVKDNIISAVETTHVELSFLVIPRYNDDLDAFIKMVRWISEIDPKIPLHVSRFFPSYQMQKTAPTPIKTVMDLAEHAKNYLVNVYPGNCY